MATEIIICPIGLGCFGRFDPFDKLRASKLTVNEKSIFMVNKESVANRREGVVEEALPALSFRVKLDGEENMVLAHLSGKMRMNHIRIMPGNRVIVEMGPDGRRGRIVRRL